MEDFNNIEEEPVMVDTEKAWENLSDRIEKAEREQRYSFKIEGLPAFYRVAAVIAICLAFVLSIYITFFSNRSYTEFATGPAEINRIILPDGTQVELNVNSGIHYPLHFKNNIRKVKVFGEAYFKVTKDAHRPFVVETENTQIRVLGTSFNVYSRNENEVEVFVEEGKVAFARKNSQKGKLELLPGDLGTINNGKLSAIKNENINYLAWKTKMLVFKATPISEVIRDLRRTYNCTIETNGANLDNLKYMGTIKNQPIDSVIVALNKSYKEFNIIKKGESFFVVKGNYPE